jgi:NAD(P)-dependent dehydrogenase (short-subunit alcohol dehydrogenase family)
MSEFVGHWPGVQIRLEGVRVLVTGGTSGIGAAIARAFLAAGSAVTITGTRPTVEGYPNAPPGAAYQQLQLQSREAIEALAADITALDVLVNNAGGTGGAAQPFDFDTAVSVNLNAVYHLTQALVPALESSRLPQGASVVNVASEMSLFGSPWFPGYGAAKAGILQLTRTLAIALAPQRIRVNALLPGSVPTPMTAAFAEDPEVHRMVADKTPLQRWGDPHEMAGPVLFLASPLASFVTGHTLVSDGGYSIQE